MKKNLILLLLIVSLNCKDIQVPVEDVISNMSLTKSSLLADGTSLDTVTVNLNKDASLSNRFIIFKVTGANIINGSNGTLSAPAYFKDGKLTASAVIIAPFKPGKIFISASPKLDSLDNRNFTLNDSINVDPSVAETLDVEISGYGLKSNYGNEITIIGTLKNMFNNFVSIGTNVVFEDHFENGDSSKGNFRLLQTKTDSSSKVSGIYSILSAPIGSKIVIVATALDQNGNKTNTKDSTVLTVIE